jgi:hypothetical protein
LGHEWKGSVKVNAVSIDHGRFFMRAALLLIALAALIASSRGFGAETATSGCEIRAIRSQEVLVGASLENWEPVDDRTVLIWTGHETRAHLVRLDRPLSGLTAAPIIDLVDGDGDRSISPCGHDGIRIGGGQDDGTVARIVSIEYLSYRRTMELDRDGQAASLRLMPV